MIRRRAVDSPGGAPHPAPPHRASHEAATTSASPASRRDAISRSRAESPTRRAESTGCRPACRRQTRPTASATDWPGGVVDVERMQAAGDVDDRAIVEKRRHRRRIERRGHHHDPQVVAGAPRLPGQRNRRDRRACCARGTRRARWCGTAESRGSCCRRAVSMPSVATSSLVSATESPLEADLPADLARRSSSRVRQRCAARWREQRRGAAAAG